VQHRRDGGSQRRLPQSLEPPESTWGSHAQSHTHVGRPSELIPRRSDHPVSQLSASYRCRKRRSCRLTTNASPACRTHTKFCLPRSQSVPRGQCSGTGFLALHLCSCFLIFSLSAVQCGVNVRTVLAISCEHAGTGREHDLEWLARPIRQPPQSTGLRQEPIHEDIASSPRSQHSSSPRSMAELPPSNSRWDG